VIEEEEMSSSVINPDDRKMILSCDGGGIRGLIAARALERLEAIEGKPCREIFSFMAGTSTGSILVACLAMGIPAREIAELYLTRGEEIFKKRFFTGWLYWRYHKSPVRNIFREKFGDTKLKDLLPLRIMITSKDTVRGETIFFENSFTFGDMLLREAVESSMSAPTYFEPMGRYVDGGVGSFNNPCYQAAVEAFHYHKKEFQPEHSRMLSFGTGAEVVNLQDGEARKKKIFFWLGYVIGEGMDDANNQQVEIVRREYAAPRGLDFRRYQVQLREEVMKQLGVECDAATLSKLELDAIKHAKLIDEIARKFAASIDFSSPQGLNLSRKIPLQEDLKLQRSRKVDEGR
jgi:hypothetical protein